MLNDLADQLGYSDLATKCEKAFQEEQEHLENVRGWLSEMTLTEALGEEQAAAGDDESAQMPVTKRSKRSRQSGSSKKNQKAEKIILVETSREPSR
jgi:hypothetical protein